MSLSCFYDFKDMPNISMNYVGKKETKLSAMKKRLNLKLVVDIPKPVDKGYLSCVKTRWSREDSPYQFGGTELDLKKGSSLIMFDCSSLFQFCPINIIDNEIGFLTLITSQQIFEWGKRTGGINDVIMGCPILMSGCESRAFEFIEKYFKGEYCPNYIEIYAFQWIVAELLSLYLCQFVIGEFNQIVWVDDKSCFFLKDKVSIGRSLFGIGKRKFLVKLEFVNRFLLKIVVKE